MSGRLPRCSHCIGHPGWAHDDESRRREPDDVCRACYGSGVRHLSCSGNRSPVLARLREDDLAHDPWGAAISWAFGVAEVLYVRGEDVPPEMEYGPPPFVALSTEQPEEYPDSEVWQMLTDGDVSVEDLQFAGRCLARYLDWLRAAGLDY